MRNTLFVLFFLAVIFPWKGMPVCGQTVLSDTLVSVDKEVNKKTPQIEVIGFKKIPNDLTARVTVPKRDQNNDLCAIIKVVTPDKTIFFEPDALGITARVDQPGEIWLYVPHGAKRITIKHEHFGVVRNFFYKESIEKAAVYELILSVPEVTEQGTVRVVERIVEKKAKAQFLMVKCMPTDAQVHIDDTLQTFTNGSLNKIIAVGMHEYRAVHPHYRARSDSFEVISEYPTALNIQLEPNYAFLNVDGGSRRAKLFVNDSLVKGSSYKRDSLQCGTYTIRAERKKHSPLEQTVQLGPEERKQISFEKQWSRNRHRPNAFLMPQLYLGLDGSDISGGLFAGFMGLGKKWGGYFSFRTNGQLIPISEGSDSGALDGMPRYNYSGEVRKFRAGGAAGVMFRPLKWLYVYAGAGLGVRRLYWKGHSYDLWRYAERNYWVCVQDITSPLLEGGIVGRYKHWAIGFGFSGQIPPVIGAGSVYSEYRELAFSIGYVFGK